MSLSTCPRGGACACTILDVELVDALPLLAAGFGEAEACRMLLIAHRGSLVPFFTLRTTRALSTPSEPS